MSSSGKQHTDTELLRVSILRVIDGNIPADIIAVCKRSSSILNQILRIDNNLLIPSVLKDISSWNFDAIKTLLESKSEVICRSKRTSRSTETKDITVSLPVNYLMAVGKIIIPREIYDFVSCKSEKYFSVDGQKIMAEVKLGDIIFTHRRKIAPNYLTPLLYAISKWKYDAVKTLLECGADVNNGCNTSNTNAPTKDVTFTLPLHYCIEVGAPGEIIDLVLSKHPKLNSVDGQNRTAFNLAISEDKYDIVKKLITLRNPISTEEWIYRHLLAHCAEENGYKRVSQLLKAENEQNVDKLFQDIQIRGRIQGNVNQNVTHGTKIIKKPHSTRSTDSRISGNMKVNLMSPAKITKQLPKCLRCKPKTGLLYTAVGKSHRNIINFLLQCGSNINETDAEGQTALHYAAAAGNVECARYLLDNLCDAGLPAFQGYSALHLAANFGYLDCVRLFFERGTDINGTIKCLKKSDSKRPHHCGWFLTKPLCNLEGNTQHISSLTLAVRSQHREVTEFLLSVGAKLNGLDELHDSLKNSNFKLANILMKHTDKSLLAKDAKLEIKALDYMAKWCKKSFEVEEADQLVKTYIQNGYEINELKSFPFHAAIRESNVALAEVFKENGVDCNRFDFDGNLPIHIAAGVGDLEVMKMLISNGADPLALNKIGLSTVHIAVAGNELEMVKFLVSLHVDVNLKSMHIFNQRRLVEACLFSDMSLLRGSYNGTDVQRVETIKTRSLHTECGISALGIAADKQYDKIANFLLNNGVVPNGVTEVHICLVRRNVKLALLILEFFPEKYSLKNDKIQRVPTLHFITTWNIMFNRDMEILISEYIRRGYDINQNQYPQMPLLMMSIKTGLTNDNLQMFDFLMSFKDCNIDVLYGRQSVLTLLLSMCNELHRMDCGLNPTNSNARKKLCCKYYIKQLMSQFASTEFCDLSYFVYHSGHADILKLLYAAGMKFPQDFRNSRGILSHYCRHGEINQALEKAELESFCDWLDTEKLKVESLQYLTRIAFRKLRCARELIRSSPLPEKIKAYLRLDDHPISL